MTQPPPPARRSGGIFKWIAIGCGGALLLLIALFGVLFLWAKQTLNLSLDPQQAEQTAQEIMDFQIPGGSQGLVSTRFSGVEFAGVASKQGLDSNAPAVALFLGRISNSQANASQIQDSFRQSMEQQMGDSFKVTSQRTESKQLCGQTVDVQISQGEQTSGNTTIPSLTYQASVKHNNETLFVSLIAAGADAQTKAEQVFSSLKCK